MMDQIHEDAYSIIQDTIREVQPDIAVQKALTEHTFAEGKIILVSVGKAAWKMANAAYEILDSRIDAGIVITKYAHSMGPIGNIQIYEAGHPITDDNGVLATQLALDMTAQLEKNDEVLFLVSGGASALFENPFIPLQELIYLNSYLLSAGADIIEINTIRKRLSSVKGGRFAEHCMPAKLFVVIQSDVIGDRIDMIASGPAHADSSTSEQALLIINKYNLKLSEKAYACIELNLPENFTNVETTIAGSVRELCLASSRAAEKLGYEPLILSDCITCEARDAGRFLGAICKYRRNSTKPCAIIFGGETVVHLSGTGLGGRNQEMALAAAEEIDGIEDLVVFCIGSDGTDGPTDAAGGIVDGSTAEKLRQIDVSIFDVLKNNDSYHALELCEGLIKTGATGTNVNDLAVALIRNHENDLI